MKDKQMDDIKKIKEDIQKIKENKEILDGLDNLHMKIENERNIK